MQKDIITDNENVKVTKLFFDKPLYVHFDTNGWCKNYLNVKDIRTSFSWSDFKNFNDECLRPVSFCYVIQARKYKGPNGIILDGYKFIPDSKDHTHYSITTKEFKSEIAKITQNNNELITTGYTNDKIINILLNNKFKGKFHLNDLVSYSNIMHTQIIFDVTSFGDKIQPPAKAQQELSNRLNKKDLKANRISFIEQFIVRNAESVLSELGLEYNKDRKRIHISDKMTLQLIKNYFSDKVIPKMAEIGINVDVDKAYFKINNVHGDISLEKVKCPCIDG